MENDLFNYQSHLYLKKLTKMFFLEELASSKIQTKITTQSYSLTEKGMQEANKNFTQIILQAAKCSLTTVSRKKNIKTNEYQEKAV